MQQSHCFEVLNDDFSLHLVRPHLLTEYKVVILVLVRYYLSDHNIQLLGTHKSVGPNGS